MARPPRRGSKSAGRSGTGDGPGDGRIMVGARVTPAVVHALKRAATEMQIAGKTPNSQQGIIEAALVEWLKTHKFL